jgi:uncharacterized repeat protein (TIGR01451 family)
MKSKIVLFSVLAVLALFAVSAVPSASMNGQDNEVYFVPEDSNGLYCENIPVLIMVDAVDLTTGAGMDIYFDPDCVNITNVDFTGTPYSSATCWKHYGDHVRIGVMGPMDPIQPGTHLIANLTLHCENEAAECKSDLVFTEPLELLDYDGDPLPNVIWRDGTFSCGVPCIPSIDVNKTVWDKESQAWVDETTAEIGENVRFRCEMHNNGTCCPLTNFVVTDILSDSLEYADNATVDGQPWEPEMVGPNEFRWNFPYFVLVPCQTITIEFDARVIDYGYDCNVQNATAICEETGVEVSDEDTACVDVQNGGDNVVYFEPEDSTRG